MTLGGATVTWVLSRATATSTDPDGAVVATRWRIYGGPQGTPEVTSEQPAVNHVFTVPGSYTVALEVEDNDALLAHDQLTVQVANGGVRPPRIVSSPSMTATVGQPYRYDEDGLPSAQGSRPLDWDLGRDSGNTTLNVPVGMTIPLGSSEIRWTPTADQVGDHQVTLGVANPAGADFQDFTVTVYPEGVVGGGGSGGGGGGGVSPPRGCASTPTPGLLGWLLLGVLGLGLRVRRWR